MSGRLEIVITGASDGVGAAAAIALASPGRRFWLLARRLDHLAETAAAVTRLGAEAETIICDIGDRQAVEQGFARIGGRIDVLINAAALPAGSVASAGPAEILQVINTNLIGTMLCAREAGQRMQAAGRGTIVNIGSLCVRVKDNGASLYVAAKLGVAGFTDAFRKEMAPHGIRVMLINPGQIASGMVTETPEQKRQAVEAEAMLTPAEVAEVIRYAVDLPERVVLTELELRPRGQSYL